MATLSNSCDSCIQATIPHCSLAYTVCGVLTASTDYWSVITDKFGKKHIVSGTTDADGVWTIDPADYPDGFFSQYGGVKTLRFFTDANLCDIATLSIGDPAVDYTCITLSVVEHSETYDTWDVLCLCEAVTPPAPQQYLYALLIKGDSFDPLNDRYNYLRVDGTTYSAGGASLLDDDGGGSAGASFTTDLNDALLNDGLTNEGFYRGYSSLPGLNPRQYFWLVITDQPHTIQVNVTLNGVDTDIPLLGGLVTMVPHCSTFATADPVSEILTGFYPIVVTEDGATINNAEYIENGSPSITDEVACQNSFDTQLNTNGRLIAWNYQYVNNGDGTVTFTYDVPHTPEIAPAQLAFDLKAIGLSPVGTITATPCP